jgi:hypothetical protein
MPKNRSRRKRRSARPQQSSKRIKKSLHTHPISHVPDNIVNDLKTGSLIINSGAGHGGLVSITSGDPVCDTEDPICDTVSVSDLETEAVYDLETVLSQSGKSSCDSTCYSQFMYSKSGTLLKKNLSKLYMMKMKPLQSIISDLQNTEDDPANNLHDYLVILSETNLTIIARNASCQVYSAPDLHRSYHFTVGKKGYQILCNLLLNSEIANNIITESMNQGMSCNEWNKNFIHVNNTITSQQRRSLDDILRNIIADKSFSLKKDTSKPRKAPALNLGWTTTNCNNYYAPILGQSKGCSPSLIATCNGTRHISEHVCSQIGQLVVKVFKHIVPEYVLHDAFNFSEKRREFNKAFGKQMGVLDNELDYFKPEALSIIQSSQIGLHKDNMNAFVKDTDHTISYNTVIDNARYSIVFYSRKCITSHMKNLDPISIPCKTGERSCYISDPVRSIHEYLLQHSTTHNDPSKFDYDLYFR